MENLFYSMTIWGIMIRFLMNLVFLFILIRLLYFRYTKKEKFLFTYFVMGIAVFFVCSMLKDMVIEVGIGLGLFAIFNILRFRTRNFSVKDMAYTFSTMSLSVINSMNIQDFPVIGYIIINSVILLSVFILEEFLKKNTFDKYSVNYDNLELLKPGNNEKLKEDLSSKTGINIVNVEIKDIDLKKGTAELDIFFKG